MSRFRLYIDQPLASGTELPLPADQAHYLRHVLRMNSGDSVTLFNGTGGEYSATIRQLSRQFSSCIVEEYADVDRELPFALHLIQCANRSDKIETVLQKGTELGAAGFQIAVSERSALKLEEKKQEKRLERWQKIVVEAAEQSGRTALPSVAWVDRLADAECHGLGLLLHPEGALGWQEAVPSIRQAEAITLAVGPEGGWSPRDIETWTARGFTPLAFGSRILRTETAGPTLLAAIQAVRL